MVPVGVARKKIWEYGLGGTKVVRRVPCREQCRTPRVSGKAAGVAELKTAGDKNRVC